MTKVVASTPLVCVLLAAPTTTLHPELCPDCPDIVTTDFVADLVQDS